jgi:NADPH-dependent glutamate synthase beta subunit-like oxidoreductase
MPALPEEVAEAVREGIQLHLLASPVRILGRNGRAVGMECVKMTLGELDESGRRRPVPIERSNFKVGADGIVAAIGQSVDRALLKNLDTHRDGTVRVNPETEATSMRGVFAGGDVVTGPGWAIDAIAAGKRGAKSIHEYLPKRRKRRGTER